MYIQPNSTVKIYSGIPLDNTYNNTLWFDTPEAQRTFFASNVKASFNHLTYQRVNSESVRLQANIGDIYDVNYMAFQNTAYGNKWFYAFITAVEYINDNTCEIVYELDYMQTYLFDVTLLDSFVEREHSATDEIGDNIVPENLEIGEYFMEEPKGTHLFDEYTIAVQSTVYFDGIGLTRQFGETWYYPNITGNKNGLDNWYYCSLDNTSEILFGRDVQIITSSPRGNAEDFVSVYLIPTGFVDMVHGEVSRRLPQDKLYKTVVYEPTTPSTLGEYGTPRNKKLLTYPFNKFVITTYNGEQEEYAYEFFGNQAVWFRVYANLTANTSFKAIPFNYKGQLECQSDGVVLTDIPMLSWKSNAYDEWLARNKTRLAIQGLTAVVGSAVGIGSGMGAIAVGSQMLTPKRQVLSAKGKRMMEKGYETVGENIVDNASTIGGIIAECVRAQNLPDKHVGSGDGSLEISLGIKDFNYIRMYVNPFFAKLIDEYFDMYGYATNEVKKPNRNVREQWTYTKTIGCNVKGKAPVEAIKNICAIYDKGITFWRNANNVGDYSLPNNPLS